MPESGNRKIAKNAVYMYIRMLLTLIVSLYTSRVVLHTLGEEDFGTYSIVGGVVVFFTFISNAMATGTQRHLSYELGKKRRGCSNIFFCLYENTVMVGAYHSIFSGGCRFMVPKLQDEFSMPEESSFFTSIGHSFPAVCIRTSTERPEALDKGCFVLSGIDTKGLLQSVDVAVSLIKDGLPGIPVPDYTDENVSTKVVRIIQSYVGVVNKMVWRKEV